MKKGRFWLLTAAAFLVNGGLFYGASRLEMERALQMGDDLGAALIPFSWPAAAAVVLVLLAATGSAVAFRMEKGVQVALCRPWISGGSPWETFSAVVFLLATGLLMAFALWLFRREPLLAAGYALSGGGALFLLRNWRAGLKHRREPPTGAQRVRRYAKERRRVAAAACLLAAAALAVGALVYWLDSYAAVVRVNWGLELPRENGEWFVEESGSLGGGWRYHVLWYEDEEALLRSVSWQEGPSPAAERSAAEWLEHLEVPADMAPDFEAPYLWYSAAGKDDPRDRLNLFYFRESGRLCVVESFW